MEVSGPIFDERGQDLIEYNLLLAFIALRLNKSFHEHREITKRELFKNQTAD